MNKDEALLNNMVVLARRRKGKKKGSARSQMLRMIMPMLSRENGEKLANAIEQKDANKMRVVWDDIKQQIANKLSVEASANGTPENSWKDLEYYLEHMFDDILPPREEMLSESAATRNVSRLITGNARIPSLTRDLVANGFAEFTDAKNDSYTVSISSTKVSKAGKPQPLMSVTAVVESVNGTETVSSTGIYGDVCSEIIIAAMSFSEND